MFAGLISRAELPFTCVHLSVREADTQQVGRLSVLKERGCFSIHSSTGTSLGEMEGVVVACSKPQLARTYPGSLQEPSKELVPTHACAAQNTLPGDVELQGASLRQRLNRKQPGMWKTHREAWREP